MSTLKNNNARLTSALQESTANVEEWKRQLHSYKVSLIFLLSSKATLDIDFLGFSLNFEKIFFFISKTCAYRFLDVLFLGG